MKKYLPIVVLATSLLTASLTGCKKESANDEYYVKYEIKSTSLPYYGIQLNTTFTDEKNSPVMTTINTGSWTVTIGPVKKGFVSSLKAVKKGWQGDAEYYLKMTLSISVSKNASAFALKKLDDPNTTRATAQADYIIE